MSLDAPTSEKSSADDNVAGPYDALETRDPATREAALLAATRAQIAHAKAEVPAWAERLDDTDPAAIVDRKSLAHVPLLRKSDLIDLQGATPPFGDLTSAPAGAMARLFLSPGPIAEPQARRATQTAEGLADWRMDRALYAAGFRAGDRVGNFFSYHVTPAGFMFDGAAQAIGCAVYPGGVGQTETHVAAFRHLGLNAYTGTPDFLGVILERAEALGTPISTVQKALVSGGPLFPALRDGYAAQGIEVRQCYGTAELGLIAYETAETSVGMAVDEHCLVEIVRPGTGEPVADGEVGEVVVTTFEGHYPLIRLATGDLSAFAPDHIDAAGRTARRLKGWMGRADQTTKVRGMFVHPRQVADAIAKTPEVIKARLVVVERDGRDAMTLHCEVEGAPEGLATRIADAAQTACRIRADVTLAAPGSLPNDGKVIDDQRTMAGA